MQDNTNSNSTNNLEMTAPGFKRSAGKRVFVNRSIHLDKIKIYGFDMDYTLAEYISPDYEMIGYELTIERLIHVGYPETLRDFKYDHTFPLRGLWFDKQYGNLLKVDAYGNILVGTHGLDYLSRRDIEKMYPNKFLQYSSERIFILNTLFNLPECYILAVIVKIMDGLAHTRELSGVQLGDLFVSYKTIFQDVRGSVDYVHLNDEALKQRTLANLSKYVRKDERLPILLDRIRGSGAETFILTNSDYLYTNGVMGYLLNTPDRKWQSFFNYIVVDGRKPLWFSEGTIFRQVDEITGAVKIGRHIGPLKESKVYSGGSCDVFNKMVGASGKDVLYVGDHIFGDVLKSKKQRGWRTFLVVPELLQELRVWTERKTLFDQLQSLDDQMAHHFGHLDSSATKRPALNNIQNEMRDVIHQMDMSYGVLGSLFRSGSRLTFFASQVERFADIYSSSCCNLVYYPFFYMFRAPPMLMPHESTVEHKEHVLRGPTAGSGYFRSRMDSDSVHQQVATSGIVSATNAGPSDVTNNANQGNGHDDLARRDSRAATPPRMLRVHDDDSDEESPPGKLTPSSSGVSVLKNRVAGQLGGMISQNSSGTSQDNEPPDSPLPAGTDVVMRVTERLNNL